MLAVERPFAFPIPDALGRMSLRIVFRGVMDLVLWDPHIKDIVLTEHKTSKEDARKAEFRLDMDPQTTGYVWVLTQAVRNQAPWLHLNGSAAWVKDLSQRLIETKGGAADRLSIGRVFYNVVRKSGPKMPKWNKDGTVSAAAVDTKQSIYELALREQESLGGLVLDANGMETGERHKPKPRTDKQTERMATLEAGDGKWIMRHEDFQSELSRARWLKELRGDGKLVRDALKGKMPITRNDNHCNKAWSLSCGYRSICKEDTPDGRSGFHVVAAPHTEVVGAELQQGDL